MFCPRHTLYARVSVCVCNSVPRRSKELKATPAKSLLHLNDIIMHAFGTRLSGQGLWLRLRLRLRLPLQQQLQLRLQLQFQLRLDHLRVCLSYLCLLSAPLLSPSLSLSLVCRHSAGWQHDTTDGATCPNLHNRN